MKLFDKKKKVKKVKVYTSENAFSIKEVIGIILITSLITVFTVLVLINNSIKVTSGINYFELTKDSKLNEFLSVYSKILDGYYEDVDSDKAIDSAIDGLIDYLGDKYTSHLTEEEADRLAESLSGKYQGIGIKINNTNPITIVEVFENSPAEEAGIKPNDLIMSINDIDVTNSTNSEVTSIIKSDEDKKIKITIKREEELLTFEVEIKELVSPSIDYEILEDTNNIGYLAISTFSKNLKDQVNNALNKLEQQEMNSLIIDLRGNSGGYLSAAEETASLFLEEGKVIYSLESKSGVTTNKDKTEDKKDYKIVVLMNAATASASEILASALVDSYGAVTVGTTSYGKGKVQQTMDLDDGSLVKYTTSKWLRPNGECIDGVGLTPTYEVEQEFIKNEDGIIVEVIDRQLERAIELLNE